MTAFRFRQRRTRRWWYIGTTFVIAAFFTVFLVSGALAATFTPGPSGFESGDGNMALDAGGAVATDWNCFQGTSNFFSSHYGPAPTGSSFTAADCKAKTGAVDVIADSQTSPAGELEQKSGQKFDTTCPTFQAGNNPPKDEWTNVAEYTEAATNGDLFFYGATIRPVVNGNTSGNVYFDQGTNPLGATCHVVGDVLIAFDFVNGGGTPSLHSLTWINSPATATTTANTCDVSSDQGGLCWGNVRSINTADFNGNVNTTAIAAADNGISGTAIAANAFAEFGINLTQALVDAGITTVPCFANQTWVSRSSGSSFTSNPEDVEIVNRQTCGSIEIIKHTLQGDGTTRGVDRSFAYTTSGTGLSGFNLNDKTGSNVLCSATVTTCNDKVFSGLTPGSYGVTETLTNGAPAPNFAFTDLSCTPTGNGTTASPSSGSSTPTATITLGIGGSVICTYTNQQQLGAIKITKTSSKGTHPVLSGAKFYICTNNVNSTSTCLAPTGVTNPVTTGTDGTYCQASLSFGNYYVFESAAPGGYAIDSSASQLADVNTNGDCAGNGTPIALSFTDTPLTTLEVIATGEAAQGTTKSTISCTHQVTGSPVAVGTSITTPVDPADWKTLHLTPDTYTCTIVIDP